MIKHEPFTGYGVGGFSAHYMDYQAQYFKEHPDSQFAILADNIKSPLMNTFRRSPVWYSNLGTFDSCWYFLDSLSQEAPNQSRICVSALFTFHCSFSFSLIHSLIPSFGLLVH